MRVTPKPTIPGTQTAVVTGPPGEEIWPDEHGRIKVQFFWDRVGERDEQTTCWIRCAQIAAGKNWGAMFIPRIGQEVVVTYLEGDPDRPLIIGSVYNAEQTPRYDLPGEKTKSYIKTNSSPGGEGYNEIRFEDKKDKEQIFIHAERNMDVRVKNNSMERVIGHRHQVIGWEKDGEKGGDQKEKVWQDRQFLIKRNEEGHVEGNVKHKIGGGEAEEGGVYDLYIDKQMRERIGDEGYHLTIEGDRCEKIGGQVSVTIGANYHEKTENEHAGRVQALARQGRDDPARSDQEAQLEGRHELHRHPHRRHRHLRHARQDQHARRHARAGARPQTEGARRG